MTATTAQRLGVPIHITLCGPWKGRDINHLLGKWGLPRSLDWDTIGTSLPHFRGGGFGAFSMPTPAEVARYVRKAVKHPDAATAILALARVALFALDLADALALWRWLLAHDPQRARRERQHEWRDESVLAVSVLQARWPGGSGLADPEAAIEALYGVRADLDALAIDAVRGWMRSMEQTLRQRSTIAEMRSA